MKTSPMAIAIALAAWNCFPAHAQSVDPLAPTGQWSAYTSGRADLPPMGWSSWNAFEINIDEDKIMGAARTLVDSGLARKGYRYVNIDDGWALRRDAKSGRMIIRSDRFPSSLSGKGSPSFRGYTNRLHAMGLKAGIYSDLGRNTCSQMYSPDETNLPKGTVLEREVGLYGHIDQDIALYFKDWGFDYIKVDGCGVRAYGEESEKVKSGQYRALAPLLDMDSVSRSDIPAVQSLFREIDKALVKSNPDGDFLLSLCIWGTGNVRAWGKDFGNVSRTSDDINPTWSRMLTNFDSAAKRAFYAHPGAWNDPDMLFIGKGDFGADHLVEARSHFSLWAIINAPLLIGMDMRQAPQSLLDILGNTDVIAVNQDPAGHQGVVAYDSGDVQALVKTLSTGEKAVAIVNRGMAPLEFSLAAAQLKYRDDADVEMVDLWTKKTSSFRKETKLRLAGHETLIFRVRGGRMLSDGLYLSEQPGNVNPAVDGVVSPQPDPTLHKSAFGWAGTHGPGERPIYAGWGGAQADTAPYGATLRVGGQKFTSGIGILANSRLEVRNKGYRRFSAMVGVDDSAADPSVDVTFMLYGDGKLLATSKPLSRGDGAASLNVAVDGVALLELVTRSSESGRDSVPVSWGEAALLR